MPKSLFVDPKKMRAPGKITFQDIPVNAYKKTLIQEKKNFSNDDLVRVYRDMSVLREFESMLNAIKTQGTYKIGRASCRERV